MQNENWCEFERKRFKRHPGNFFFFYFKAEMIKSGCLMLKQQSSNEAQVQ